MTSLPLPISLPTFLSINSFLTSPHFILFDDHSLLQSKPSSFQTIVSITLYYSVHSSHFILPPSDSAGNTSNPEQISTAIIATIAVIVIVLLVVAVVRIIIDTLLSFSIIIDIST